MNDPQRHWTAMLGPRAFYHGFDKTSANATRCPPSGQTEQSSYYAPRALRKQHLASGDVSSMIFRQSASTLQHPILAPSCPKLALPTGASQDMDRESCPYTSKQTNEQNRRLLEQSLRGGTRR
ncbi:hypothetical protein RB213_014882 [Colletotrichum asianum]